MNRARLASSVRLSWKAWCDELVLQVAALADVAGVEDEAATLGLSSRLVIVTWAVQLVPGQVHEGSTSSSTP